MYSLMWELTVLLYPSPSSIVGEQGFVYSFESYPDTYKRLVQNIMLNSFNNIHAFNYAVSSFDGKGNFLSANLRMALNP